MLVAFAQPTWAAEPQGGFLEPVGSAQSRQLLSQSQINNMLPNRGKFTFPAPYGTEGFRLTNASDCGGSDCVHYVGYSYWRNSNNHVGQDTMLILVGLNRNQGGAGPSLIGYNKLTEKVTALGPVFSSNDSLSWSTGEGLYFSGTMPTAIYVTNGPRLSRYDVFTRQYETVFNVQNELGGGRQLWQAHSSDDDRVHSATVKNNSYADLGCVVYREDTNQAVFFPKIGGYDECQIDKSGKWLVIKEDVDGRNGEDNRIINVDTLEERVLLDEDGAGGHSDMGHGYMIAQDNWASRANTQLMWKFDQQNLQGTRVYYNNDWGGQAPAHVSHTNSLPGVPTNKQFACGSSVNQTNYAHGNEIICFGLVPDGPTLVVAPVMTSLNSSGGDNNYGKAPKGNLDVTGRFFIWTSNMRSSRLDTFMVKVPAQLLDGVDPLPEPPPPLVFSDDFEP
jgi:hypothetical protein